MNYPIDHLGARREWLGMELGYQFHWLQPLCGSLVGAQCRWWSGERSGVDSSFRDESRGLVWRLDAQSRQESTAVSGSMEVGIQWTSERGTMQLGLCAYSGMDDTGKRIGAANIWGCYWR